MLSLFKKLAQISSREVMILLLFMMLLHMGIAVCLLR